MNITGKQEQIEIAKMNLLSNKNMIIGEEMKIINFNKKLGNICFIGKMVFHGREYL
jgi:hypothetical protein